MKLKGIIGIQARSDSKRLPGKMFEKIGDKMLLQHVYDRCAQAQVMEGILDIDTVILCPTGDEKMIEACEKNHMAYREGDKEDLIKRYLTVCNDYDLIVRVTGDCWQINPRLIESAFKSLTENDYVANTIYRSYPEGWDVQAGRARAWEWLDKNQKEEREHPWSMFDSNSIIRDQFVKDGLKWYPMVDSNNVIFKKTSIDTAEELAKAHA